MRGIDPRYYLKLLLLVTVLVVGSASTALAVSSQSDNFRVDEAEFGAGAALETCSGQYCAQATIGNMVGGEPAATVGSGTASFGSLAEQDEPLLEVIIEDGQSSLGVLKTDETAYKETLIKVRSYLSDGYTLQILGQAPTYESHSLATSQTPVASQPGQEQFGINLVANTTPPVGADLVNTPSDEFSFGTVEPDYTTPNQFMYQDGAVVARSLSQSGQTDYTISMIVNVSGNTPAGHFAGDFAAVVIPIF